MSFLAPGYHARLQHPVIGMNMFSESYLSDSDGIKFIQTINKNNTRSKFQSDQTHGLLQGVINGTRSKQGQKNFNRKNKVLKGDKHYNQLNIC